MATIVEILISLFKKIAILIVIVQVVLPIVTILFNFISTVISVIPAFALHYIKFGFAIIAFKLIKDVMADV